MTRLISSRIVSGMKRRGALHGRVNKALNHVVGLSPRPLLPVWKLHFVLFWNLFPEKPGLFEAIQFAGAETQQEIHLSLSRCVYF